MVSGSVTDGDLQLGLSDGLDEQGEAHPEQKQCQGTGGGRQPRRWHSRTTLCPPKAGMPAGPDSAGSRLLVGRLAFTVWMVDTGVDTQAQPGVDTFSSRAVAVSLEGRDQAFCSFLGKHAGPCMKLRTQQGCGRGSGPAPTQGGACSVRTWL